MKKFLVCLLALSMIVSMFAACGGTAETPDAEAPATDDAGEAAEGEAAPEETFVIRHNISSPDTDSYAQMATKWGEEIMAQTNGGITVENFYNNALGENDDVVEQALAGAPILAGTDPSRLASYVPEFGLIQMPYLLDNVDDLNKIVETPSYASWVEELNASGLQLVVGNWYSGERNVLSNSEARVPADLSGLRLRTIGNDICVGTVNAMGAVATPMAFSEVYQSISLGGLEGCEIQSVAIESSLMYEVANVLSKTGHFQLIACEVMGAEYFNSMPAEYQQVLLQSGKEMGVEQQQVMLENAAKFEEEFVATHGGTIVEIEDKTPFIEATTPLYEELGFTELRATLIAEMDAIA